MFQQSQFSPTSAQALPWFRVTSRARENDVPPDRSYGSTRGR